MLVRALFQFRRVQTKANAFIGKILEKPLGPYHIRDVVFIPPFSGCGECRFCLSYRSIFCQNKSYPHLEKDVIHVPSRFAERAMLGVCPGSLPLHIFGATLFMSWAFACIGYPKPLLSKKILADTSTPEGIAFLEVAKALGAKEGKPADLCLCTPSSLEELSRGMDIGGTVFLVDIGQGTHVSPDPIIEKGLKVFGVKGPSDTDFLLAFGFILKNKELATRLFDKVSSWIEICRI